MYYLFIIYWTVFLLCYICYEVSGDSGEMPNLGQCLKLGHLKLSKGYDTFWRSNYYANILFIEAITVNASI